MTKKEFLANKNEWRIFSFRKSKFIGRIHLIKYETEEITEFVDVLDKGVEIQSLIGIDFTFPDYIIESKGSSLIKMNSIND